MQSSYRRLVAALAGASVCVALSACGSSGSSGSSATGGSAGAASSSEAAPTGGSSGGSEVTTIRVGANTNAGVLPLWVAQKEGYFKKKGLKVDLTTVGDISKLVPALGKSFDIVFSTVPSVIQANANGIGVMWVAGSSLNIKGDPKAQNGELLAKAGSGITSVKQLAGKTIGAATTAGTTHIATLYWLNSEGVKPSSVKVIQVPAAQMADQLKAGRIAAVESVPPYSQSMIAAGAIDLGPIYAHLAPKVMSVMWAAQTSWVHASGNSEVIEKFQDALKQGAAFIKKNNAQARKILAAETGLPAKVANSALLPHFDESVRPQDLKTWISAMKVASGFKGTPDVGKMAFEPTS